QFLGGLERPDVDKIDGLSPVIAIEQKTTSKSPRSTVGTITEIYDFLRLLYARASDAYSYNTGEKMVSYSDEQIQELILADFDGRRINILSPVIRSRKGHYRELFEHISKQGFAKVRVNGELLDLEKGMKVDRYKTHDIEIVVDRLIVERTEQTTKRLSESIQTAMYHGDDVLMILDQDNGALRFFSRNLMCPTTGISYPKPEPNTFSFNSPKGMCPRCSGLGSLYEVNVKKVIADDTKSIKSGGILPIGPYKSTCIFKQLETIAQRFNFKLTDAIKDIPEQAMDIILNGGNEKFQVTSKTLGITRDYKIEFEGINNFITNQFNQSNSSSIKRWAKEYMDKVLCQQCGGSRLKESSLHFKIDQRNIAQLASMDMIDLAYFFDHLKDSLSEKQFQIAEEILKE